MATARRTSSLIKNGKETNIASWNIQGGIQSLEDSKILINDMAKHKVEICCLQETRCGEYNYTNEQGTLICLESEDNTPVHRKYGQGFYISKKWMPHFWGIKRISNRISVINFLLNKSKARNSQLTIINVYAPTSLLVNGDIKEAEIFYEQLQATINMYNSRSDFLIVAGDFNSKLGINLGEETFLGHYGKGTRNRNGHLMAAFMMENKFYATNTTFQHLYKNRTTWCGNIKDKQIFNQIDYIIIKQHELRRPNILRNSRSHEDMNFSSDHKIVITTLDLTTLYIQFSKFKTHSNNKIKVNRSILAEDETSREKYQKYLEKYLLENKNLNDPNMYHDNLMQAISKSVKETLPQVEISKRRNVKFAEDQELQELSRLGAKLLRKIRNCKDIKKRRAMRSRRQETMKKLKKRIKYLQYQKILDITKELEQNIGNKRCFEAQRKLNKHTNHSIFTLLDETNKTIQNPIQIAPIVTKFYDNFFNQAGKEKIEPWEGLNKALQQLITADEVERACMRLNNGRTSGKDGIYGEYVKYSGKVGYQYLAEELNLVFNSHQMLDAIGEGILIPLNKTGKSKKVENTRPITLVNIIRKVLSNVVLERIYPTVDAFVTINQSGFRRSRSTSDIIWGYKWLISQVKKYQQEFVIMGIDLSKAFDCIDRTKLLDKLKELLTEDEYRIIKFLLSNTSLEVKINDGYGEKFGTTIGTPQGDALSPILFIIYLEMAMRYHNEQSDPLKTTLYVTHYADDTDFIAADYEDHVITNIHLKDNLNIFNLKLNEDKTEYILLNRATSEKIKSKKLGTILSDKEDMKHRIKLSEIAFNDMWKIWLDKKNIKLKSKVKLYNACVKPILLYNLSSLGVSMHQLTPIITTHRRHLRRLAGIFYPNTIKTENLYQKCETVNILADIISSRWRLFGHILRSNINTPANQMMLQYFSVQEQEHIAKFRGRPLSSLSVQLDLDLKLISSKLEKKEDLDNLRNKANDRKSWKEMHEKIVTKCIQTYQKLHEKKKRITKTKTEDPNFIEILLRDEHGRQKRIRIIGPLSIKLKRKKPEASTNNEEEIGENQERKTRRRSDNNGEINIFDNKAH